MIRFMADRVIALLTLAILFGGTVDATANTSTVEVKTHVPGCVRALHPAIFLHLSDLNASTLFDDQKAIVIATLKELLDNQIITSIELRKIAAGQNPLATANTPIGIEFRPVVDEILEIVRLGQETFVPFIQNLIDETVKNEIKRNAGQAENKVNALRLSFYPIKPPDSDKSRFSSIHETFWIANYTVTQWQFAMVMGFNPSYFSFGPKSTVHEVLITQNGQVNSAQIRMLSNHPVEFFTEDEEASFIQKLNELSRSDDPLVYKIIQDHKRGWHYRKPTPEEREFVARNRGVWKGDYPDGITEKNLSQIAWYNDGRKNLSTHPVGVLEPTLIDEKYPIYDLLGNVWERTSRSHTYGGGWSHGALNNIITSERLYDLSSRHANVGLRLVRTPP